MGAARSSRGVGRGEGKEEEMRKVWSMELVGLPPTLAAVTRPRVGTEAQGQQVECNQTESDHCENENSCGHDVLLDGPPVPAEDGGAE